MVKFGHIERKWKHETNQHKMFYICISGMYSINHNSTDSAHVLKFVQFFFKFGQRFTIGDLKSPAKIKCNFIKKKELPWFNEKRLGK